MRSCQPKQNQRARADRAVVVDILAETLLDALLSGRRNALDSPREARLHGDGPGESAPGEPSKGGMR